MPQDAEIERRLAAVLAADVAGFGRLTELDEVGTIHMLTTQRAILDAAIARHKGRIANTAGDSVLADFPSAVNAVQCAVEAQQALRDAAEGVAKDRRVLFRIGINVGDVMVRGGDLFGGGVNVAARLEGLADAGGIVISASAHEQVRKILPLAYADLGPQQVKNHEEPIRAFAIGSAPERAAVSLLGEGQSLPLPDKPSIAVLPFQNMSGDPEQEYFADGVVEDIITALSRFNSLFVIARNSSFTYKAKAVDIKRVGRELGVRYVLEGSLRKAGGRVRIAGQLIDAQTGAHLWADKFEGPLENIFALQDEIAASVAGAIAPKLLQATFDVVRRQPPRSTESYDYYIRGVMYRHRLAYTDALVMFRKAIELDPGYGLAYARAANCIFALRNIYFKPVTEDERIEAIGLAEEALRLAGDDAEALASTVFIHSMFNRDHAKAAMLADRAIQLNANLSVAWNVRAWTSNFLGEHERALGEFAQAMRLNPVDPLMVPSLCWGYATVYNFLSRHAEALEWAKKMLTYHPSHLMGLLSLAFSARHLGNTQEAGAAVARIRTLNPELTRSYLRKVYANIYCRPEDQASLESSIDALELPA